jgi:hypothetical protein
LIQYHPDWNDPIRNVAQGGTTSVLPQIKRDEDLGADVTSADPGVPGPSGALWKRHDGVTTIDQSQDLGTPQDPLKFTLATQNTEGGFSTTGSAVEVDGTVQATLTFTNWFVRWLGIYLLFLDSGGVPLDPSGVEIQLPPDYDSPASDRAQLDQFAAMFALMLGPEFTVLGIPVASSRPPSDSTSPRTPRRSGFSRAARPCSSSAASTPTIRRLGATGSPAQRALSSSTTESPSSSWSPAPVTSCSLIQQAAILVAPAIAKSLTTLLSDELRDKDFSTPTSGGTLRSRSAESLLQSLLNKRSAQLLALITSAVAEGVAEDCIPIVGQIALGISLAAGAATNPGDHDRDRGITGLVRLRPDPGPRHPGEHPARPEARCVPRRCDALQGDGAVRPRRDAVHADASHAVRHREVAAGSRLPERPFRRERHVDSRLLLGRRLSRGPGLDGVGGQRRGQPPGHRDPGVPRADPAEHDVRAQAGHGPDRRPGDAWLARDADGAVGKSRHSRLRTGRRRSLQSSKHHGPTGHRRRSWFVGYAFQSFSSGVAACVSGGQGQLDQLANMGDVDPASGYVTPGCGLQSGSKLTYSLFPGNSKAAEARPRPRRTSTSTRRAAESCAACGWT